jgi:hypothetical protein
MSTRTDPALTVPASFVTSSTYSPASARVTAFTFTVGVLIPANHTPFRSQRYATIPTALTLPLSTIGCPTARHCVNGSTPFTTGNGTLTPTLTGALHTCTVPALTRTAYDPASNEVAPAIVYTAFVSPAIDCPFHVH